ncbi:MAG: hypothetical protein ACJ75J_10635 [Cytophagaceae bacterium]
MGNGYAAGRSSPSPSPAGVVPANKPVKGNRGISDGKKQKSFGHDLEVFLNWCLVILGIMALAGIFFLFLGIRHHSWILITLGAILLVPPAIVSFFLIIW